MGDGAAVILDRRLSGTSELGEPALRTDEDVVDHRVGWSDLAVAVVPGELVELEEIARGFDILAEGESAPELPDRRPNRVAEHRVLARDLVHPVDDHLFAEEVPVRIDRVHDRHEPYVLHQDVAVAGVDPFR